MNNVNRYSNYCVKCDICGKWELIPKNSKNYNVPQAVRSIGWKFTRARKIICTECQKKEINKNDTSTKN